MIQSGRVNYCSWIIVGLLGILLSGCANAAAANTRQQQQWENVGTINKVPVCTKIGGSLYCN